MGLGPNECLPCLGECYTCNINDSYCFSCDPGFYHYNYSCNTNCTNPDYFADDNTWTCLECSIHCVKMTMNLFYKDSLKEDLVCDLIFTQDLTWGPTEI